MTLSQLSKVCVVRPAPARPSSSSPGPPGYVIFILQMFFQEECVSQAARMRKVRPFLLRITALESSPLRPRHSPCFCRLAKRAGGPEKRRFQQGRDPTPGIAGGCKQGAKCAVCWTSVEWSRSVLWRGASPGVKTGGLLASVWDRLPVAGVSSQCLREKNEVMHLHCLLTFRAEGGGVRSPSGLIACARKRLFLASAQIKICY